METVEITVQRREERGKEAMGRMRRAGQVPAVLYGKKRETVSISVSRLDYERAIAVLEGSHLIRLVLGQGLDDQPHDTMVLVREVQRHPVTGDLLHADFFEVDLTERLQVAVPLHFVGKAAGVVAGGILQPILREVLVECLPTEIPEFFEVDVSHLGIHEAVHLAELQLPTGVTTVGEGTRAVVTVLPPTVEARPAEAEAATPAPAPEAGAPVPAPEPAAGGRKGSSEG